MNKLKFISKFSDLSEDEKPREKLIKNGGGSLTSWELIALILRTGINTKQHKEDVIQLAKRLLVDTGFRGLFTQKSVQDVQENFGIYRHHAIILVACSEIMRRLNQTFDTFDASEPSKVFAMFKNLQRVKNEQCFVLCLDENKKCVFQEMIAMGQKNIVRVTPNDILRTAIWLGYNQIILVHNHLNQSETKASEEDIQFTKKLEKGAFDLHKIKLIDHLIIGRNGYFSFQEKGIL